MKTNSAGANNRQTKTHDHKQHTTNYEPPTTHHSNYNDDHNNEWHRNSDHKYHNHNNHHHDDNDHDENA